MKTPGMVETKCVLPMPLRPMRTNLCLLLSGERDTCATEKRDAGAAGALAALVVTARAGAGLAAGAGTDGVGVAGVAGACGAAARGALGELVANKASQSIGASAHRVTSFVAVSICSTLFFKASRM